MTLEKRWQNFSSKEHLLHIASELSRACHWENINQDKFRQSLERILELIDLSLGDQKWQDNRYLLFILREEIAKFYIGEQNKSIKKIYDAI